MTNQELPYMRRMKNMPVFKDDDHMIQWLEENGAFYQYGHRRTFLGFYFSDYCLDSIYDFLTKEEVAHLKIVQAERQAEYDRKERERWHFVKKICYADNSIVSIWEDDQGNRKEVVEVMPHGDLC